MELSNGLAADVRRLQSSRITANVALAHNVAFEERVSRDRRNEFDAAVDGSASLREALGTYFNHCVQGERRGHASATFSSLNTDAIWNYDVERNQLVIRVERIDGAIKERGLDYKTLSNELRAQETNQISEVIDFLNSFRGERPAFFAFRSELAPDVDREDWHLRLRNRLGLGHHTPGHGVVTLALMQYTAGEVLDVAKRQGVPRPFAIPTVIDSMPHPWFFPSPKKMTAGFTVALDGLPSSNDLVSEMLHLRMPYRSEHLMKVAQFGKLPRPDARTSLARDAHLMALRARAQIADFGLPMHGLVDDE